MKLAKYACSLKQTIQIQPAHRTKLARFNKRYDPDRIVQHYYKQGNKARLLLTVLIEAVTDAEIIRNVYATFEKHIHLKEACRDWNRGTQTTWEEIKKHFSKEIQINKTDPTIMKRMEVVNAVLA